MYGARVVSGKILSVTTDPGDFIEDENFSRAPESVIAKLQIFSRNSFF